MTLLDSKATATIINKQVADNEAIAFKNSIISEGSK
jgi:hypothetical protein